MKSEIRDYLRGECCVCHDMHNDLRERVVGNLRVDVCWYPTADRDCEAKLEKLVEAKQFP